MDSVELLLGIRLTSTQVTDYRMRRSGNFEEDSGVSHWEIERNGIRTRSCIIQLSVHACSTKSQKTVLLLQLTKFQRDMCGNLGHRLFLQKFTGLGVQWNFSNHMSASWAHAAILASWPSSMALRRVEM